MQPEQPNLWLVLHMLFIKMVSAADAKEAELQGASSVMRVSPNLVHSQSSRTSKITGNPHA
jgi:hypothetical protein